MPLRVVYGIGPIMSIDGQAKRFERIEKRPRPPRAGHSARQQCQLSWRSSHLARSEEQRPASPRQATTRRYRGRTAAASIARGSGWTTTPPVIIGPTWWRVYSSDAAIPKLPPPPRIAQNRSGFSSALARSHTAVGRHHVGSRQVVERKPVLRHQPAESATECQTSDPCASDDAARRRESVQLCLAIELLPEHAALSAHRRARGST